MFEYVGYNSLIVILSCIFLGASCGFIGIFIIYRKKSLVIDALSHSTLPGIGLAFVITFSFIGKNPLILAIGGALSAAIAALTITFFEKNLPADAAIGSALSVFYALGIVVLGYIQHMPWGQSGIAYFLLGSAATLSLSEALTIISISSLLFVVCYSLKKELLGLCYDYDYMFWRGFGSRSLDLLLMSILTIIIIVGLPAVGVILIIALPIIPAASASILGGGDFSKTLFLSSAIGALSAFIGSIISLIADLPTGPMIVICASSIFLFSMFRHWLQSRRLARATKI